MTPIVSSGFLRSHGIVRSMWIMYGYPRSIHKRGDILNGSGIPVAMSVVAGGKPMFIAKGLLYGATLTFLAWVTTYANNWQFERRDFVRVSIPILIIFGGAVFLLQRKVFDTRRVTIRRFRSKQCPQCQTSLDLAINFCPNCGYQVKALCESCKGARYVGMPVCPACGARK